MLILPISSPNKCRFFAKYRYFMIIFGLKSVKYPDEMKCINHIILLGYRKELIVSQTASSLGKRDSVWIFLIIFLFLSCPIA